MKVIWAYTVLTTLVYLSNIPYRHIYKKVRADINQVEKELEAQDAEADYH